MPERVVYRHPKGRFEVRERTGRCALGGGTYAIREAVLTPQKDSRGTFHRPRRHETARPHYEPPEWKDEPQGRRRRDPLTAQEKEAIVRLFREGCSLSEIGRRLNRSYGTIGSYLEKIGERKPQPKNFFTPQELEQAETMLRQGMRVPEIAWRLGRSKDTLYHALANARKKKNAG